MVLIRHNGNPTGVKMIYDRVYIKRFVFCFDSFIGFGFFSLLLYGDISRNLVRWWLSHRTTNLGSKVHSLIFSHREDLTKPSNVVFQAFFQAGPDMTDDIIMRLFSIRLDLEESRLTKANIKFSMLVYCIQLLIPLVSKAYILKVLNQRTQNMYKSCKWKRVAQKFSKDLHSHDIIHFTSKLPKTIATDNFIFSDILVGCQGT